MPASRPPYYPLMEVDGRKYFPHPYSLDPLPATLSRGLIAVGLLALLSTITSFILVCFIIYRIFAWRFHYRTFIGYNQYILLVLNLLLADLQQSTSFLISFHWISKGSILAPSGPCTAQAWLLHSGDVSSGFFVLAIALHTYYTAVAGKRIGHRTFVWTVIAIWIFTYFLTAIGLVHGDKYFVRAGAWCWVSEAYEPARLALHYIWVFIVQFGTILIYIVTFIKLRSKTNSLFAKSHHGSNPPNMATVHAVNRITKLMTLYPCVYVLLTLPLSAGRMWSMANGSKPYSDEYALVAGALITSCGWADTLLYTLTRRKLLKDTMPQSTRREGSSNWDKGLGSQGITHTRTVTVEGGQMMDTIERPRTGRHGPVSPYSYERSSSPTGSIDPILDGGSKGSVGRNKTEISVGLQEALNDDLEKDDEITPLPRGWSRHGRSPS